MEAGDTDIGDDTGVDAMCLEGDDRLVGDRQITGTRGDDDDIGVEELPGPSPEQASAHLEPVAVDGKTGGSLLCRRSRQQHGAGAVVEEFGDDPCALIGLLPRAIDRFGHPLSELAMVVDRGPFHVGEGQAPKSCYHRVGLDASRTHVVDELSQGRFVHGFIVPCDRATDVAWPTMAQRVGFFGPFGTFTQQALNTLADLADAEQVPFRSVPDVLDAVESGDVDLGLVPIENSIEGMVNFTQDALAFDHELLIVREVVIDIEHCLLARPGVALGDVVEVYSIPVATAQCHHFLRAQLPAAEIRAANSTAEAARIVATDSGPSVALAPRVAAEMYGLEVIAADIADHEGNQTRFVLVARDGVPAPTGHDRTALVIYQRADEPGSLVSILQEFTARRINLSNLTSRPTKAGGLGDYCFIVYAESHVADELLADTMRALHAKQGGVKFLGSYPAAGAHAETAREHADARWHEADDWVRAIQARVAR